jgi:hypothetical protein
MDEMVRRQDGRSISRNEEPAALFIPALGREDQLGRYGLCDPPEPTPGASWMVPEGNTG